MQFLRGEVDNAAGNVKFTPTETEAFEEGTVGWATTMLTITLPDGQHVSPRWSSVFHLEGDSWRFVQTHASIGVDNDVVGWIYSD
ncbi:MAG: nuclear transport factor 2 family protein [Actinomycetota bacterium]|nr:nuclear transport factor 2 family protein [Actinomycetota bacterium]